MSRRGGSEVVVIMWRDIPAQINGKAGADKHQVILPHRFQKAIDRAAMVAGKPVVRQATDGRGASNARFKATTGWEPSHPSWRQGFFDAI